MPEITLSMSAENAARLDAAFQGLWPIPQVPDPGNPGEFIPEFTPMQWAKICFRRFATRSVFRHENKVAREVVAVPEDPDIVS